MREELFQLRSGDVMGSLCAHSKTLGAGVRELEPLFDHLRSTAEQAAAFAAPFGLAETARVLGWVHDFGKASDSFQAYIRTRDAECEEEGDDGQDETSGCVRSAARRKGPDHATAGARWLVEHLPPGVGALLGYVVAGHHAGLPDGRGDSPACLSFRLTRKVLAPWEASARANLPPSCFSLKPEVLMVELAASMALKDALAIGGRLRFLYSALVDADFLATERFMDGSRAALRTSAASALPELEVRLTAYLAQLDAARADDPLGRVRRTIRQACLDAAGQAPGLFTLEVPTGSGKTLSSLAFALRHARLHGLARVVYVIPYTSIIEQTAEVFRSALGEGVVLEHHSNRDPEEDGLLGRLQAENWDAPVIVTTNVQFFESLYANRPSRCRKLHNLARAVVVLDEAQSLPTDFLRPCLHALDELMLNYGASVVLCTATLPAFFRGDFRRCVPGWNGLAGTAEGRRRIGDGLSFGASPARVRAEWLEEAQTDAALSDRIVRETCALVIVSTRRHARRLWELVRQKAPEGMPVYHLSAQMCPAHRMDVLASIRARLRDRRVLVVSTQLVEAGVDLDFPCVYREIAGCDALVQAAGRCNREGRLPSGRLVVFESAEPHALPKGDLAQSAAKGREVLALPEFAANLLSPAAVRRYFCLRYDDLDASDKLDQAHIFERMSLDASGLGFRFRECARDFRLIPDEGVTVYVPYDARGRDLCERLRATQRYKVGECRALLRQLARYGVSVHGREPCSREGQRYAELVYGRYWVLTSPELNYSSDYGLSAEAESRFLEV